MSDQKSIKYETTIQAQLFLINLHHRDLLFHLDDNPHECIGDLVSEAECENIRQHVDAIFDANLDWGLFDDEHGFCIALHNGELDQWIASYDLINLFYQRGVQQ